MPEGDVLRLTAARLDAALTGQPLTQADLRWPDLPEVDLLGAVSTGTSAYGKHLLTRFDNGWTLHTHLRMEGEWYLLRTGAAAGRSRWADVRAVLATTWWTAIGHRLGMLDLLRSRDESRIIGALGPDILADDFLENGLPEAIDRLRRWQPHPVGSSMTLTYRAPGEAPLSRALLDQHGVAGLGTIWVAESLWAVRQWPWTPVREADLNAILRNARTQMKRSVTTARTTAAGKRMGAHERRAVAAARPSRLVSPARRPVSSRTPVRRC